MNPAGPNQARAGTGGDAPTYHNATADLSRLETRGPPGLERSMWRTMAERISVGEVESMSYPQLVAVVKML